MEKHPDLTIRPYTHKELAAAYGVSWVTFRKWIKTYEEEIGPKTGHFYNSRQVEIIFQRLGYPKQLFLAMNTPVLHPHPGKLSIGI